jgi:acid stress-induced BolA-like protein IbaG/YrbA
MKEIELREILLETLKDAHIEVRDLTGEGNHFEIYVESELFESKSRLEQQRMVMNPFKELLKNRLHALAVKTNSRKSSAISTTKEKP